jgi:hypothetical protein
VVDLEHTWMEAGLKQRQELQRVVFPDGLAYSMETAFFAPRNHSIMQDFDEFFVNWRTVVDVGVPNHVRLNLAVRLRAFLLRFTPDRKPCPLSRPL